jgi:hypothetical protein
MDLAPGAALRSGLEAVPTRRKAIALARFFPLIALASLGCATDAPRDASEDAATREAAYQQCLRDNMAVAMAWEAIEARCREETGGGLDPIGVEED